MTQPNELNKPKELISTFFFYLSILFFIIGFNFSDNRAGGWTQQFMPNLGGAQIRDITFTDSLNGYAVTSIGGSNSYILKTTNGGDNWTVKFLHTQPFVRVEFINADTGFTNAFTTIFKTTNAGENWTPINLPGIFGDDMFVLSKDTIWLAMSESLTGGVYRTTNGGVSWQPQATFGNDNPSHIYMYNARIGFIDAGGLRKTMDGGATWTPPIAGAGNFLDMFFVDSLIGWKCNLDMKKTTDGGLNWINQTMPSGGNILGQGVTGFMNNNNDTIWALGETIITGGSPPTRGILFRTINSGSNWLFQLPDTSIHINRYPHGQFINNKLGWAYSLLPTGIHTTTGGNDTFYTSVKQISTKTPDQFKLFQNYPNPFNPSANIKYQIARLPDGQVNSSFVILEVFDISGRLIKTLVSQKQSPGEYTAEIDGSNLSSGIYFYRMQIIDEKGGVIYVDTKKAILIK